MVTFENMSFSVMNCTILFSPSTARPPFLGTVVLVLPVVLTGHFVWGLSHTLNCFLPKILSLLKNSPTFLGGVSSLSPSHSFLFRKRFLNFLLTRQCPWLLLAANLRHLLACRFSNEREGVCVFSAGGSGNRPV